MIYSIISLTRKNIHILYKKCQNVTMIKQIHKDEHTRFKEVYIKDLL
jgi:hypothetical protein